MAPSKPTWQLNEELHRLRVQLNDCETFFDMLWKDYSLSKLFRTDLAKIRCKLCDIYDCSTRDDPEECLRVIHFQSQEVPESDADKKAYVNVTPNLKSFKEGKEK
jgi:hypothetical protein